MDNTTVSGSRHRLLVVDDDDGMVRALSLFLRLEGFDVITADNGGSALAEIELSSPDAVILDLRLPVMGGKEVCLYLRNRIGDHHTPVIVLTGMSEREWRDSMLSAGANEFITKPCDVKKLTASLRGYLDRDSTSRQ